MTNAYQLNDIHVSFKQKEILNIDALSIAANQCTALLGSNGAGKSTLLRLLAFTQQADQGQITLFDDAVSWPLKPKYRKRIAFVEQHPFLLNGTVYDNIKLALSLQQLPASQHPLLIEQALEQTHTSHLSKQNTQTLSGGEQKRVAIARAIAYQPDILLLDEPFSHLDYDHIELLEQHIQAFAKQANKTLILSTHDHQQGIALSAETINLHAGKLRSPSLENRFTGQLHDQTFTTPTLRIHTTSKLAHAHSISIDPKQIIISNTPLESSMQNTFSGTITYLAQHATTVHLTIDCGETFHAIVSKESVRSLKLQIGKPIYLSFKASSVSVF